MQRVRSWTVQNEVRGVLGRVSAAAARRILDSANCRYARKSLTVGCVRCSEDRENTVSLTRDHMFLGGNRGSLCVEELR